MNARRCDEKRVALVAGVPDLRCKLGAGHEGGHQFAMEDRETAVEHLRNARQMLLNLKQDLQDAQRQGFQVSLLPFVDQVEAADKRLLKTLVQITNATASLDTARRALTP